MGKDSRAKRRKRTLLKQEKRLALMRALGMQGGMLYEKHRKKAQRSGGYIIQAIIALLATLITCKLIPWIQSRTRITGAHTTMPIEDMKMVRRWLDIAKEHDAHMREGGVSWYLLVMLGFNTSLRIGDLCKLRVEDVRGREWVRVIAEKTDKMSDVKLQAAARDAVDKALKGRDKDEYVFCSRQRSRKDGRRKAISR